MKIENRNQKGITLIGLVVTIIVLIILAAISISVLTGDNGLTKTSQTAKADTERANIQEQIELAVINSYGNNGKINVTKLAKELSQIPDIKYKDSEITSDTVISLPAIIQYKDGTNFKITDDGDISVEVNTDTSTLPELASNAKPGDYVKYVVPTKTFTMTAEETGYSTDQTYNTSDYEGLWQVLYNDEEHGLQIISSKNVTNEGNLYLGTDGNGEANKRAYNNSVTTLNKFCSNYVNIQYAISGRSVGSDPINSKDTTQENEIIQTDNGEGIDSGYKVADENYITDYNAMKSATSQSEEGLFDSTLSMFWLASRHVTADIEYASFSIRLLDNYGTIGDDWWISNWNDEVSWADPSMCGVRACITLRSGIKTNNGNGTKENPYELVAQ